MSRFILENLISKSPKVLFINNKNNIIGNCTFSIINYKKASINNLFIKEEFRKKDNGTKLLRYTEELVKTNYNIEETSLLAHEKPNDELRIFFEKNGYKIKDSNYKIYNDGSDIFNLIPMYKVL
tara:strand:- start:88 stop:459 length:372 start_codon:yes stop_codon:yes gene_type:complete